MLDTPYVRHEPDPALSGPEFWQFVDTELTPLERKLLNEANSPEQVRERFMLMLYTRGYR